ncbi:hypothetical protein [Cryptosporangium minutisporangium]|uniref:DUF4179 domain-containing protein n=1 Tax=Cryptosporangium minutisporangium TaxID=113569 RepID=A0ABP6STQ0_9ACTN
MDERSARTMFRRLAERDLEETTVDVDEAIRGGRRRRRRRRLAWIAGAAVLVIGGIGALTAPMLRDDPKAIGPAGPRFVKAEGADLKAGMQRLQVGWAPDGVTGTATYTADDHQSVQFLRTEDPNDQGGGPLPGYGPASVWLAESASTLTFSDPGGPTEPGPDIRGVKSTWFEITNGEAPGGTLTWTPSPGLRAMVVAGSKATAARIADSVRTDQVAPVVLPFSMPRPRDLEVMGTEATRYDNGHYSGSVSFRKAGDTTQFPSELKFWLAQDERPEHNGKPTTTLHGRPVRLSDGPPENGVNVWLHLEGGVVVGSLDSAQQARYLRDRNEIIAMVESIEPVKDPGDYRNWTKGFLR